MIHRLIFGCIDARWKVRWKDLWTPWAGDNETYTGYIDAWDSIPWQEITTPEGLIHDYNHAARAQYLPKYGGAGDYYGVFDRCVEVGLPEEYCHHCLGLVQDLIALLESDGIDTQEIKAQYAYDEEPRMVLLRDSFFRNFDPANIGCPIVYSRPMTYALGGAGHIGDNSMMSFFIQGTESCDGTEGLRIELAPPPYRAEFRADAIHFSRTFKGDSIPELPHDARLVMYAIAAGSVPRININGTWYFTDPAHSVSYGDPYGFCWRGRKHTIGRVSELPLHPGEGETNEVIVEHIAPRPETIGCQVVFSFEWGTEIIIQPVTRRKKVAGPRRGEALGDYLVRWNQMIAALADELLANPHMKDDYDALLKLVSEVMQKDAQQEILKGQLKDATSELKALIKTAESHYSSLRHLLEAKFGTRSQKLTKYITASQAEVDKTKGDHKPKPEEPEEN